MEQPAGARGDFLDGACQGDADLRREVASLLSQDDLATEGLVENSSSWWSAGAQVGSYKLEAPIGAGGMGQVFRAVDTRLHRTVAIKFLHRGTSRGTSDDAHARFLREARAASALNHPNIVTVYDISSHEASDFLVMEYVQGQTLEQLIPAEGLPPDKVAALGAQIASALHAAHEAGIVHRDVKPANVMVTASQQAKVLDFGIAKMPAGPEGMTATIPGMVLGTAAYMSPEQTRGEPLDRRSDIFSLGCLLYKAATGRLPFTGASHWETMHKIATAPPPGLSADLPVEFRTLVGDCLQKDPACRPGSAAEVAERLRRPAPVAVRSDGRRSIAVVPFRFRGAASEDRFLSVALAESVATRLSSTGELHVRPTSSVLRYAETEFEWTDVARELNVDLVVEGAIQKSGSRLRVMIQAHRANDGRTLHSSQHDGDQADLFALQDRIADSLVGVFVKRGQAAAEPATPPTSNPLAYELYLRAADRGVHINKFDLASAIEMLSRAVELDPDFADAWGHLAHAYSLMGMHLDPNPQWFEKGEQAVARALELDPVQCDALCGRAQILWSPSRGFQHRPALRAMNAALKMNPSRHLARHFRSAILFHLGSYEQSKRDAEESLLSNPNYAMGHICLGMIAWYTGDYEKAKAIYERCLAIEPSLLHANIFGPMPSIYLGRFEEARAKLRKARPMTPAEPQLLAADALIYAFEGDFRRAEDMSDEACSNNNLSLTHTHHIWHCAAGTYAIIGRPEKTMEQLKRCATMGLPNYRLFLSDPALASMRNHPEFIGLMSDLRRGEDQYRVDLELAVRADR
jgi:serine/threonine protein kinase/tetratricopeptide (TPR) repeat protein